jgi:hypothetical protein
MFAGTVNLKPSVRFPPDVLTVSYVVTHSPVFYRPFPVPSLDLNFTVFFLVMTITFPRVPETFSVYRNVTTFGQNVDDIH